MTTTKAPGTLAVLEAAFKNHPMLGFTVPGIHLLLTVKARSEVDPFRILNRAAVGNPKTGLCRGQRHHRGLISEKSGFFPRNNLRSRPRTGGHPFISESGAPRCRAKSSAIA